MPKRTIPGVCRHCSGGCGLLFHIEDDEIAGVAGDPAHPVNQGLLCPNAAPAPFRGHPARVARPLWRPPGAADWRPISWQLAVDKVAGKLKASRDAGWIADAARTGGIAVFGSAAITNEESYLLGKFTRLLGSNYIEHQARV